MMQPKNRIKRRIVGIRHVPAASDCTVDVVVNVLQASVSSRVS
jgi:hypothetical protein